jgi:hypothetical protein
MTSDDRFPRLVALIDELRAEHPNWFRLRGDGPASDEDLEAAERDLGCRLPLAYRQFVRTFGGGEFAFTAIYSPTIDSEKSIVEANRLSWVSREEFVAFADNGAGDYYGWVVINGEAVDEVVLLDHNSNRLRPSDFPDFIEFIEREGLRQQ